MGKKSIRMAVPFMSIDTSCRSSVCRSENMKNLRLAVCSLVVCLNGCLVEYSNPVGDGGIVVDSIPYVGTWSGIRIFGDSGLAEGRKLQVVSDGANKVLLTSVRRDGSRRNYEGKLARVGDEVFISVRGVGVGPREGSWKLLKLSQESDGAVIVVSGLGLGAGEDLIGSGVVAGEVIEEGALVGDKLVLVDESSESIRAFAASHATQFDFVVVEIERVQ